MEQKIPSPLKGLFLCFALFASSRSSAQTRALSNPSPSPEAKALYCYIQNLSGKKILAGQMWSGWGFDELAYIQTNTGKQPAIMGLDFIQESVNNTQVTLATNWWKKGGIPTIMWHWGAPSTGEGYPASQNTIDISKCFQAGTAEYTAFWADLKTKGDHLQALRDANVPVLWRPFHELNGGWFWWSKGGAAQFKQLWTTMYDYFVNERKLNNLIWVLCYDGTPDSNWFPGNQYVDIAGGDEYAGTNDPQAALYNKVKSNIGGNAMPITLHECGIPPDPTQCVNQKSVWSWFMEWHTTYIQGVDKTYLKTVYTHDAVVTLDEVGNIMAACGATSPSPTVALVTPANNSSACTGVPITISATATITSGSISKVDFYEGSTLLGSDNSSPYSYVWSNPSSGVHTISATATSAATVISTTTASVTVNPPTAIDPFMQVNGGAWTKQSTAIVCEGSTIGIGPHPYTVETGWSWTGPGNFTSSTREIQLPYIASSQGGTYKATFKDANGCSSKADITVTVNPKPKVTITSPAENAVITTSPSTIQINTTVKGTEIANVRFYEGENLLGQDSTSPYNFTWNNVPNGSYKLMARVVDNNACADTALSNVTVAQVVTNLEAETLANGIVLFPNPFAVSFTIKASQPFLYTIYDVAGTEVEKGRGIGASAAGQHLAPGIYLVKIQSGADTETVKVKKF